ncbi:dirigent protein 21-like [Curcuma longa]|uniref:dirigent protein 21-like n=1 Tax=Curcuma longa TaxID=136217 RepID=UPI003D9F9534
MAAPFLSSSSTILHLLLLAAVSLTAAGATVTHLHFFWHDVLTTPNATAITVVQPADPSSGFGATAVIDDAMTEGPDASSALVGRAQGFYVVVSQNASNSAILMVMNLALTAPEYNGSTISIMGRNPVLHQERELPVVGGTGQFRQGRGYALLKTYSFDATTGNAVVEYDVYVTH